MPSDYLLFRQAADDHERLATLTGCAEQMGLARELRRRAVEVRWAALHPPQKCIDCRATIAPEEMQCRHCGRARQGIRLTRDQIENLARFFQAYDFSAAQKIGLAQKRHQQAYRDRRREGRAAVPHGQFRHEGSARAWAARLGIHDTTLLHHARRLGSLRAAVEHYSPGAWTSNKEIST